MLKTLSAAAALIAACGAAHGFDLQGHRGARGIAPENTLTGFAAALAAGVSTLEIDLAVTRDGVVVVSHDRALNPDHTRGPDGTFLAGPGPAIHSLMLAELKRYDVGRIKPGTAYAAEWPEQKPADGERIPTLAETFALAKRLKADHVRFNIETKLTPTSGAETPDPDSFAAAVVAAVRAAGMTARVTVQSFDWRTLIAMRRIAPEIERVCLTIEDPDDDNVQRGKPGPSPWLAGFDIDEVGGSVPKLAAAAGCATWSPYYRDVTAQTMTEARAAGVKVIPWTVNDRTDMDRLIAMGVDGLITDYPDRLRAVLAARGLPLPPQIPASR